MSKIIFTKGKDGRIRCNGEFFNSVISDEEYKTRICGVIADHKVMNGNTTVFTLFPKCSKMLYAVDKNEIVQAFAVQQKDGQIKIIFNDGSAAGKRVYIEDGDVMFTNAVEAMDYVMKQNKPKTEEKTKTTAGNVILDLLSELLDDFGIKIEVPSNDDFFDERPDFKQKPASDDDNRLSKLIEQRDKFRKAAKDILDAAAKLSKEMDDEAESIDKQIKEEYGLLDFE